MRGLRGGLRSGLRGPLRGFGAGGSSLPGGTLAAVSGPGVFEAIGGTWTIGDTSPVLWTRSDTGVTSAGTPALVSAWADVRPEVEHEWARASEAAQPTRIVDARGVGISFPGSRDMSCNTLGALPVGTAAATIAIALEATHNGSDRYALTWITEGVGVLSLRSEASPISWAWRRSTPGGGAEASNAQGATFAGVVVGRYTGSTLLLRVSGVDAAPVSIGGSLATEFLTLGGYLPGQARLLGTVREVVIWDRALSDSEAAAVDLSLRVAWGY